MGRRKKRYKLKDMYLVFDADDLIMVHSKSESAVFKEYDFYVKPITPSIIVRQDRNTPVVYFLEGRTYMREIVFKYVNPEKIRIYFTGFIDYMSFSLPKHYREIEFLVDILYNNFYETIHDDDEESDYFYEEYINEDLVIPKYVIYFSEDVIGEITFSFDLFYQNLSRRDPIIFFDMENDESVKAEFDLDRLELYRID